MNKSFCDIALVAGQAYAGIGSRETPDPILRLMAMIGQALADRGLVLRSGGADGADSAFAKGAGHRSQIFVPWRGFNGTGREAIVLQGSAYEQTALDLARRHHPKFDACSRGAQLLHGRNGQQLLGVDLKSPSAFVICWTPRGEVTGGTGQAIRLARFFGIPDFNLFFPEVRAEIIAHLGIDARTVPSELVAA